MGRIVKSSPETNARPDAKTILGFISFPLSLWQVIEDEKKARREPQAKRAFFDQPVIFFDHRRSQP